MKEQFYTKVITSLADKISAEDIRIVSKELSLALKEYELTKACFDIVPYNYVPRCVNEYLAIRKIEGIKPSSLKHYSLRLEQFFKLTKLPIDKVTLNGIRLYLYSIQEASNKKVNGHMSDRTLDGIRTILSTFFKWACAEGYITTNPCSCIKPIK